MASGFSAASLRALTYEYDYQGRLMKRVAYGGHTGSTYTITTTTKFLYDGWNLLAEFDGNLVRSYLWGLDLSGSIQGSGGVGGLIAAKPASGVAHFCAYDGNGNVVALVEGSTGTISAQYEYGPFGEPVRVSGPMGTSNPVRFSTKYTDSESDYVYYGYRFYNPNMGRWLNRDPIEEQGGHNLYGFVAP